jgi:hypothetical protein
MTSIRNSMKVNASFLVIAGFTIIFHMMMPSLSVNILRNEAIPDFPDEISFVLSAKGEEPIESVQLEFGTDALACGQSTNRALPEDFAEGTSVDVEWTWNLRRTGPIPPGTKVWWRWILQDSSGNRTQTPVQELYFEDESHDWETLETESLILYWYAGDSPFAQNLIDAGEEALGRLLQMTGVEIDNKLRLYIYANSDEMQSATLFAPDWSGGLAFAEHSTVLAAIDPASLDWGKRVVAHELTHVIIGRYTFSCIESMPIWFNEGLAMNTEGELEDYYKVLLEDAINEDDLQSVRELGEIFSNDPTRARLAYAQSYSLVSFLIDEYGQEKMLSLLDAFRDGTPEDQALLNAIGLDRDGLEGAWREDMGAPPMKATPVTGPTPTRTPYPTFAPITGPMTQSSETPAIQETATSKPTLITSTPAPAKPPDTPLSGTSLVLMIVGAGGVCVLVAAVLILWRRLSH